MRRGGGGGVGTAGERLATALRTSQPAGVRSEVIAPGHTNGEALRGPVRRTPGLGTGSDAPLNPNKQTNKQGLAGILKAAV